MATNNFDTQVIIGKKNTYTTFQAVLKDSNGDPVSGVTFVASDVKILQYLSSSWDVSNIDSAPTEIGSTGVYFFQLNPTEVNPDAEWYPVGILVQKGANGDSIAGFFTIKLDAVPADAQYIMGASLGDNNATLKLAKLHIKNYQGEVPVWDDAVVIEGKSALRVEGNDDTYEALRVINNGDGYGVRIDDGVLLFKKGEHSTVLGADDNALSIQGDAFIRGCLKIYAAVGNGYCIELQPYTGSAIRMRRGLPTAGPGSICNPAILIDTDPIDDGFGDLIVIKPYTKAGEKSIGIKVYGTGAGENVGVEIDGKTLPEIADFLMDTDTNMSQAIKEVLSYAAGSTERDVETGTITYKDRSGNPIFTLTPAINGRTRGSVYPVTTTPEPEIPIPQIMNNNFNRHFNNPD